MVISKYKKQKLVLLADHELIWNLLSFVEIWTTGKGKNSSRGTNWPLLFAVIVILSLNYALLPLRYCECAIYFFTKFHA